MSYLPGGIIWQKKPMPGHERLPTHLEFAFEERVQASFKRALRFDEVLQNDKYATRPDVTDEVLCELRFGVLDCLPESSLVVRTAEEEALKVYQRRVQMEHGILAAPIPAMTNEDEYPKRREWVEEYDEMSARYCFNLKFCYPMYAHHHVDPLMLKESGFGKFHCPCGRACFEWRTVNVVLPLDGDQSHYWGKEKKYCLDYCGGATNDVYSSLDELLIHLEEGSDGPMHHAAAAYLRAIYYYRKRPIPSGLVVNCVDTNQILIKQEGDDFVVPKQEEGKNEE
jgi:hypothetical protein